MKKYYMCGTGEELKFGDMVELDLVDKKGDSKVHHHIECKFMDDQECIDMLLDLGAIEEKEVEDKELIDFSDEMDVVPYDIKDVIKDLKRTQKAVIRCDQRILALEEALAKKDAQIEILQDAIKVLQKKKK